MAWVVDTSVLIDILEDDPEFGQPSAQLLDRHAADGLAVCPVTYVELAPAFEGDLDLQNEFLTGVGVDYHQEWTWRDTIQAHSAWGSYIGQKRFKRAAKRPLADILIGAFAVRHQGLITRNPDDFQKTFPQLPLRIPKRKGGAQNAADAQTRD